MKEVIDIAEYTSPESPDGVTSDHAFGRAVEDQTPTPVAFPDAVMFPISTYPGEHYTKKALRAIRYAEPVLGSDRNDGMRVYVRFQPDNLVFATCSLGDTLFYPIGHCKERQPRYDWKESADGMLLGYLKHE